VREKNMKTRRLGRTGHESTLAIFGSAAFFEISQADADDAMKVVIESGVNHIDVAPLYGQAEERLGPWLAKERDRFFLGCKTEERNKEDAAAEMRRSLKRLQVDSFDLYQLHAVCTMEELDQVTGPEGALEAIIEAREEGLTRFIGITGHGMEAPSVFLEALRRFDFDTVLFPLNFVLFARPGYRKDSEELLRQCKERDVGVMIIKTIAKGPWAEPPRTRTTWYEPFEEPKMMQRAVDFVLSQDVTGLITAGDTGFLPRVLAACERFTLMSDEEQDALIAEGSSYELIFKGPRPLSPS
jgi:aryl-alcohol dehydrogenase-like predicted oxidoreductase